MNCITATYGDYVITKAESGAITVTKDGEVCANIAQAIRDIAKEADFDIDPTWNTRTAGANLINYLLTDLSSETEAKNHALKINKEKRHTKKRVKVGTPLYTALCEYFKVEYEYREKKKSGKVELIYPICFYVEDKDTWGTCRATYIKLLPGFCVSTLSSAAIYVYEDDKSFDEDKPLKRPGTDKMFFIDLDIEENLSPLIDLTDQLKVLLKT